MKAPVILVAASLTLATVLAASLLIAGTRAANTTFESSAGLTDRSTGPAPPAAE
jgi:hypothetical protein